MHTFNDTIMRGENPRGFLRTPKSRNPAESNFGPNTRHVKQRSCPTSAKLPPTMLVVPAEAMSAGTVSPPKTRPTSPLLPPNPSLALPSVRGRCAAPHGTCACAARPLPPSPQLFCQLSLPAAAMGVDKFWTDVLGDYAKSSCVPLSYLRGLTVGVNTSILLN